jgi:hypothetical protein
MAAETVFEWMERTRLVDMMILLMAVGGPLLVAGLAWLLRGKSIVENYRADWVLALISGPVVFLLWRGYNGIMDRFGLESIRAFGLAVLMFAAAAAAVAGLMRLLDENLKARPGHSEPGEGTGTDGSSAP